MSRPYEDHLAATRQQREREQHVPPHPAVAARKRHVQSVEEDLAAIVRDYAGPAAESLQAAGVPASPLLAPNSYARLNRAGWLVHRVVVLSTEGSLLRGEVKPLHRSMTEPVLEGGPAPRLEPRQLWRRLGQAGIGPGEDAIQCLGRVLDVHTVDDDRDWGFTEHPTGTPPQVSVVDLSVSPPGTDGDGYDRVSVPLREAIVRYAARHVGQ